MVLNMNIYEQFFMINVKNIYKEYIDYVYKKGKYDYNIFFGGYQEYFLILIFVDFLQYFRRILFYYYIF